MPNKIVLVKHGQSVWNKQNLFTGWYDALLSDQGKREAISAGKAIKRAGYEFDVAHTSLLTRAQETLHFILKEIGQTDLPIQATWRLNERHYGALTGLNKSAIATLYGEKQEDIWKNSFEVLPPPMEKDHNCYNRIVGDERYKDGPNEEDFPMFESLKFTFERTLPYWNTIIAPQVKMGKRILIVAHGSSLRSIVKCLDGFSGKAIMKLILPNGIPFVYEVDQNLKPIENGSLRYLAHADDE